MPKRLKRLDFVYQRAPLYFVTSCVAKRRPLLANRGIHKSFRTFAESAPNHGAWVGGYVLMPDHLHLFVALDDQQLTLSAWMKSLKGALSFTLRANGVYASYWQKGFFDHVIRSTESYTEKWHYVRENPVRPNLTPSWENWPYAGEIFDLEFRDDRI